MRLLTLILLALGPSLNAQSLSLDSVLFSESGENVLVYEGEGYISNCCLDKWSIYKTGSNIKAADLFITKDSVYFYYDLESGMYCGTSTITCEGWRKMKYNYCVTKKYSITKFLATYQFNQKGKRVLSKIKMSCEIYDEKKLPDDILGCWRLEHKEAKLKYKVFSSTKEYFASYYNILLNYKGFNDQHTTYSEFKEGVIKGAHKKFEYSYWEAPNGKSSFLFFEFSYQTSYGIDCRKKDYGQDLLITTGAFGEDYRIVTTNE